MRSAGSIANEAMENIANRASERDVQQERSMKRCVEIFHAWTGIQLSELDGWRFMVALKQARMVQGKHQLDDYIDAASYLALAGECADERNVASPSVRSGPTVIDSASPHTRID